MYSQNLQGDLYVNAGTNPNIYGFGDIYVSRSTYSKRNNEQLQYLTLTGTQVLDEFSHKYIHILTTDPSNELILPSVPEGWAITIINNSLSTSSIFIYDNTNNLIHSLQPNKIREYTYVDSTNNIWKFIEDIPVLGPTPTLQDVYEAGPNIVLSGLVGGISINNDAGTDPPLTITGNGDNLFTVGNTEITTDLPFQKNNCLIALTSTTDIDITSGANLTWDTIPRQDALYAFSSGTSFITLLADGTYKITLEITVKQSGSQLRSTAQAYVKKNNIEINNGRCNLYVRSTTHRSTTASINLIENFTAGDVIEITALRDLGTDTLLTDATSTRLLIEYI